MTVQRWNPFPSEPDSIEVVDANDYDTIAARLAEAVRLLEGWHTAYHADAGMEGLDDDTTTWLAGISPFTPDSADVLRTPDDPLSPHYDPTHTATVDGVKT